MTKNLGSVGQSYRPVNFENDLTTGIFKSGPTASSGAKPGQQTFSYDIQIWKLVAL